MNPVVFFAESSTLGAILILLVYLASNIALPLYYRRYRPQEFRVVRHAGAARARHGGHPGPAVLPAPSRASPRLTTGSPTWRSATLLAAVGYAALLVRRDPTLAERVGSIVADAD